MSETEKTFDDGYFNANEDDRISPEHRAWMNDQIRETLAQIEAGKMGFRSLEDVMREFGFNARQGNCCRNSRSPQSPRISRASQSSGSPTSTAGYLHKYAAA